VLRDQLVKEVKDINSAESAAIWARRILPAKNSLAPTDARQLEEAFQARLAELDGGVDETGTRPSQSVAAPEVASSPDQDGSTSLKTSMLVSTDDIDLVHPAPRRIRDKDHVRFVAKQACLICGRTPADAHHLRFTQTRALGRRVSDEFTVPLCRGHHREVHHHGDEAVWWQKIGIDPMTKARALWLETHPLPV
jgi:hypothetical protein